MHVTARNFESLNNDKANFDAIYSLPDPREYFRILCGLDYVIPDLAKNVFRSLIGHCAAGRGRRIKVLDVGCSYGINAALVRYPLDIQGLTSRYANPQLQVMPADQLMELDRHYYRSWPEEVDADFVGLDSSAAAVSYAKQVGLIQAAVTSNLESIAPVPKEVEHLRNIDMIISTGCVGYITQKTFQRILTLQERDHVPWMVNFVLRMFPFEPIATELENFGLVTERLEGVTFVQRRFRSEEEFGATIAAVHARGLDPAGKEAEGLLHAELYVSRPAESVRDAPLNELVSVTSGEDRTYGRRYRQVSQRQVRLMP